MTYITKKEGTTSPWITKGLLIVVSAPSGAGKTSLCREILKYIPDIKHSISYTTRAPRSSERDGIDYHFVTEDIFKKMIEEDAFIEWAIVHGNYYGTCKQELETLLEEGNDIILDIDSQGAMQIRQKFNNGVFIYILPPSFEDLRERLTVRKSDSPEEIEKRLRKAREEIKNYTMYDYLIINDEFDKALERLKAIIIASRIRIDRVNPEWINTKFLK